MNTHHTIGGRQLMADDDFPDVMSFISAIQKQQQQQQPSPSVVATQQQSMPTQTTTTTTAQTIAWILKHYLIEVPVNHVTHWLFHLFDHHNKKSGDFIMSSNHDYYQREEMISRAILIEFFMLCVFVSLIIVAWRHYYPWIQDLLLQIQPTTAAAETAAASTVDENSATEENLDQKQQMPTNNGSSSIGLFNCDDDDQEEEENSDEDDRA